MAVVSFPYTARKPGQCSDCGADFGKDELVRYYNGVGGARILRERCCGERYSYLTTNRSPDDYDLVIDLGGDLG